MINRQLLLTYLYLLVYVTLSSGVILYNKVCDLSLGLWPLFISFISVVTLKLSVMIVNYSRLAFSAHAQWVLSPKYFNFPFPITLTMIHMGFSGAVAFLLIRIFKVCPLIDFLDGCILPFFRHVVSHYNIC